MHGQSYLDGPSASHPLVRGPDVSIGPPTRSGASESNRRGLETPRGTLSRRNLLPAIRSDDIIVQYLGLHVNDIVRIDRHDGTVYFRAVIANLR